MALSNLIEVKTTDNQTLFIRPDAVGAIEVVHPSARVEGHLKVYIGGYKFLLKEDIEEFLKKLESET